MQAAVRSGLPSCARTTLRVSPKAVPLLPARGPTAPLPNFRAHPSSRHFVNKARDRSVVLLPEGRLFLNDYGRQALPPSASAS
jgi:hypothetical protein